MSFLEMLDVVNEGLIAQGRGPDRVRLGLPRRHLRHVRLPDQRRRRTARTAAPPSASCTCAASRTATRSPSSRGGPRPSRSSRTWSSTAAPSTGSSQAGGYVSINVGGAPDGNAILIPKDVVEQAMDSAACIGCGACVAACKNASAHLFTSREDLAPGAAAAGPGRARPPRGRDGRAARRRRVRQLLERRRVRGGLPEGDSDLEHRADESRVLRGATRSRTLIGAKVLRVPAARHLSTRALAHLPGP